MMFFTPFATKKGDAQKNSCTGIDNDPARNFLHPSSDQRIGTNLFYEHKIIIMHAVIKILARLVSSFYPFISTNPSHRHIF